MGGRGGAGGGSDLIFPLCLYLEDMDCEQHVSGKHLSGPLLAWHRAQAVAESKNEQKNEPNLRLGSLTS